MVLFLACAQPEERPDTRRSLPGDADTDTDTDADTDADSDADADSDSDTDTVMACVADSDIRARCALSTAADWATATLDDVEAGDSVTLASSGLTAGTDTSGAYNGGTYAYGVVTSPPLEPGIDFDAAVPSWNAVTPAGTWISLLMQARIDGRWTDWYRLGVWASSTTDLDRHSFSNESDADGDVWTDTLVLSQPAQAIRLQAVLFSADGVARPTLSRLAVAVAENGARGSGAGGEAWGTIHAVPPRSQMVFDEGEAWCSPTSTSMLLAFHDVDVTVPEAADGTWDEVYEGNGNWPFNVAYAASLGLTGEIGWFSSVADLEPWIAAGVPVAISAEWGPGDLDGAPISSTDGHLLVVRGFTTDGDVAVNDPASDSDATVSRTYDRDQLEDVWMNGSGGIAYLLWEGAERPVR